MRKFTIASILMFFVLSVSCTHNNEINWKLADNPILTKWATDVDPLKPWLQYPRPDMVRNKWINLNGLWDYAITPKDMKPEKWDGSILVPYPVESAISGVKKRVSENENLWYKRSFKIPSAWSKNNILLNFEASDWETIVWVDGKEVGKHRGGYDPIPPSLDSPVRMFTENYVAELINNRPGGKIFYTTDGSEPDENSRQYSEPFKLSQTSTIKAYTKWEDAQSRVVSYQIEKKDAMPAD